MERSSLSEERGKDSESADGSSMGYAEDHDPILRPRVTNSQLFGK